MKTMLISVLFVSAACLTGCNESPEVSWEEEAPGVLPTQEEIDAGVAPGTLQVDPL